MNRIKLFLRKNIDTVGVALFMLFIFSYIMFVVGQKSDLLWHAKIANNRCVEHHMFSDNFLMYFLTNVLSCFYTGKMFPTKCALAFLIAMSNTAKYVLVKNEFSKTYSSRTAKMASLALLFVFVIPVFYFFNVSFSILPNSMYLGYYVPNVWHNSTVLCMMPFAIITFFLSLRQLDNYDRRRNLLIALFVVLGALVKPSFFFVYMVAFPICMIARYRFGKEFLHSLLPIFLGILCLLYEYLTIYDGKDGNSVAISILPLFTLEFWNPRIWYFMVSLALPVLFVLFYWKEIRQDREFWFILIMLVIALGISWCCQETGNRATHGNFAWQVISTMWFVYYYMLKIWMSKNKLLFCVRENRGMLEKGALIDKIFIVLYCVHVLMGVCYLARFLVTKNYV